MSREPGGTDSREAGTAGALAGLRVVELGEHVAAPYAAKLLADLGAEVAKIETPGAGDRARAEGPFPADRRDGALSGLFLYENTNKRGVAFDVWSEAGREALDALLGWADVLITDRTPTELSGLQLTPRRLEASFPRLVVVAITPFGLDGPLASWRGDELIAWAASGLAHGTPGIPDGVEDAEAEPPLHPSTYVAETIAGVTAAVAALIALRRVDRSGGGAFVDLSMQAAVAAMDNRDHVAWSYAGLRTNRLATSVGSMPNYYLPCRDGYVAAAAPWQYQWERVVTMLGSPEWALSPLFATVETRGENWEALKLLLTEWTMGHSGAEITRLAEEHALPFFTFHSVAEVVESEQATARGSIVEQSCGDVTVRMPGAPMRLEATPWRLRRPAPAPGEHTRLVLGDWLGWDEAALDALGGDGAVAGAGGRGDAALGVAANAFHPGASPSGDLPLAGLRVLDLGQIVAIPFCTQWLGRMGADVLLIESSKHLTTRNLRPYGDGAPPGPDNAGPFNLRNGAKRSVRLDLETAQGRELLQRLVPHCDILVDNFKTGVLERLGLGADVVRSLNPAIVQLSLGAFGRTGPMRSQGGLHSAVNLFSGVAEVTGYIDGAPRLMGGQIPDSITGAHAAWAILAALRHRDRAGEGQFIDGAMYESLLPLIPQAVIDYTMNKRSPARHGNRDAVKVPHGIYRAAGDDEWVAVSVATESQWVALCTTIGRPEWASDAPTDRRAREDEIDEAITAWSRGRLHAKAAAELQAAGVPAGPVLRSADALSDAQLEHRGFVVETDHPVAGRRRHFSVPWRILGVDADLATAPLLGQHTHEVLSGLLGVGDDEYERLEAEGVFR